jgi:hypothetical protein
VQHGKKFSKVPVTVTLHNYKHTPHSHSPCFPKTRSISLSAETRSKYCPVVSVSQLRVLHLTMLTASLPAKKSAHVVFRGKVT